MIEVEVIATLVYPDEGTPRVIRTEELVRCGECVFWNELPESAGFEEGCGVCALLHTEDREIATKRNHYCGDGMKGKGVAYHGGTQDVCEDHH